MADFACVERKVVVEVDGPIHERLADVVAADVARTVELERCGWLVVRAPNDAVLADMSGVLEVILRALDPQDL